jgi:predicted ArsR family transcriptional regulator
VNLPARRYERVGRLLATAVTDVERKKGIPVGDALVCAARLVGQDLGRQARQRSGATDSRPALLAAMIEVLHDLGYEPRADGDGDGDGDGVKLANCPFDALAQEFTELVCGMNLHLMEGLVYGLEWSALSARHDPGADRCCVRLCTPTCESALPASMAQ